MRATRWSAKSQSPCGIIIAGSTIFVGGRDKVAAYACEDGRLVWQVRVEGKAYGLAVANGRLFVSTTDGVIYSFRPTGKAAAPSPQETSEPGEPKKPAVPEKPKPLRLAMRPYLQFVDDRSAVVRWETQRPSPTILVYGSGNSSFRIEDKRPKTVHAVRLANLRPHTAYHYSIRAVVEGEQRSSGPYWFDTFFNYNMAKIPDRPSPYGDDEAAGIYRRAAEQILSATGIDRGVCLVLGSGEGRLAYELARRSRLRVIGVDTSAAGVAASRRALLAAGMYGRVTTHHVESLSELPIVGDFANLVVSGRVVAEGECPGTAAEVFRVLRPAGGVAYLGQPAGAAKKLSKEKLRAWFEAGSFEPKVSEGADGLWAGAAKPPIPGSGVWSHQYGTAANAAYGGESLRGARRTADLTVQWLGRPGPRHQIDRYQRKPSPLCAGGRLFSQGWGRIVALDAYSGVVLWSLDMPALLRFNMPRDCSNFCADESCVFAAADDRCLQIDAATGKVLGSHKVTPGPKKQWAYDWGYVGREGGMLIGSAVKAHSSYKYYAGRGAWYDARGLPQVCSDNLFAIKKTSGKVAWTYAEGVIVNSTITLARGRAYFTESRNAAVIASNSRRVGMNQLWQDRFLVALELETGRRLWQTLLDPRVSVDVTYLAYSDGKLVLATAAAKKYHVSCFDAEKGEKRWHISFDGRGTHGQHIKRPGIVGGKIYMRNREIDLKTGEITRNTAGEGCGTISLSQGVIFGRRRGVISMWDIAGDETATTGWFRLRPGCWLSTFPAAGLVLSPEAGGGCQCGKWLEFSIAFKPRLDQTAFETPRGRFLDTVYVVLKKPLGGGEIYYTLDGKDPTLDSTRYTGPILLN
ncbi:MAG: outer membrane protein assembly factor BamB family protein, partial [Planctomycetota bacterium]